MKEHSVWPTTLAASFAAFFFGTLACALIHVVTAAILGDAFSISAILSAALRLYGFALICGLPPLVLVGIPLFGYLRSLGRDSYITVGAIGLIPGIAVMIFGFLQIGVLFLAYGLGVSLLAQLVARRSDSYDHAA